MDGQEKMRVIERVKNMSDNEINILDIFMEGFCQGCRLREMKWRNSNPLNISSRLYGILIRAFWDYPG